MSRTSAAPVAISAPGRPRRRRRTATRSRGRARAMPPIRPCSTACRMIRQRASTRYGRGDRADGAHGAPVGPGEDGRGADRAIRATRASTAMRRRERERRRICSASCSACRCSSTSCTCRSPAAARRSDRRSPATRRSRSVRCRPPCSTSRRASCARLRSQSAQPSDALAGCPTIAQAGYPDIAADIWTAVLVPAGTPKEIVALLQREIAKSWRCRKSRSGWRRWDIGRSAIRPTSAPRTSQRKSPGGRRSSARPASRSYTMVEWKPQETESLEVSDHYATAASSRRSANGLARMGKTTSTVTRGPRARSTNSISAAASDRGPVAQLGLSRRRPRARYRCGLGGPRDSSRADTVARSAAST